MPVLEVNTTQLQLFADVCSTVMSAPESEPAPIMNSLVSATKDVTNESLPNPVAAAVTNLAIPSTISISSFPGPIMSINTTDVIEDCAEDKDNMSEPLKDDAVIENDLEQQQLDESVEKLKSLEIPLLVDKEPQDRGGIINNIEEDDGGVKAVEPIECGSSLISPKHMMKTHFDDVMTSETTSTCSGSKQVESSDTSLISNAELAEFKNAHAKKLTCVDIMLMCDLFYLPFSKSINSNNNNPRISSNSRGGSSKNNNKPRTPCWKCGELHYVEFCQYLNHRCRDCNRVGHKDGYCQCVRSNPGKKRREKSSKPAHTRGIYVKQLAVHRNRKFVTVVINHVELQLQLDCASDITVLTEASWNRIGRPPMEPPSQQARTASGQPLDLIGEIVCDVTLKGVHRSGLDFIDLFNLWDVPLSTVCNLVTSSKDNVEWLKASFPQLFSDSLGCCKKAEPIQTELERLQKLDIISPVEFSDWAAPIVAVKKKSVNGEPNKVRVCADYSTGLNSLIQPNQHPLPLPEEIFAKLTGSKIFTHIDLSDAYLQVPVEKESRQFLTINTHLSLFEFNRLSPGVKSAPGAFQKIVESMVAGLDGVEVYLDDVLVHGRTPEEHRSRLLKVLERIQEWGFTLRIEKCSFFMSEITYLGFIVNNRVIRPDPSKTSAICRMPPPHDDSSLRSFLGAINFYRKFVRNMHDLRHPLDAKWDWNESCQESFEKFKNLLRSDLLLVHYNPELETIVAADASNYGVGACLMHRYDDGLIKVVCHASRTLTSAEQNYGQEALALIFGVTKFHRFIWGRRFTLHTDHKPLVAVFGSKMRIPVHTSNRLQRWALILLSYEFDIEHISTQDFGYADMLSRLIDARIKPDEDFVIVAIQLEDELAAAMDEALNILKVATSNDKLLQDVIKKKIR
ncbi:uncharacterized protein LOC120426364 [Culex pipiens pallens]|uniref:uncharacterized protein LOC120426364 n=1 Tax=Culex pipiens pallens TaxID=42434 RepID=UPI0022AA6B0A|nr:uncharacterized protein LOC120426364 [Culex pipiens pallens]